MKKTCESCGGSGQISYFKGVSRFLLSSEECPECAGLGYILPEDVTGSGYGSDGHCSTSKKKKAK